MNSEPIKEAARKIKLANHIVALTGAGISVESGIPPFRGDGGIWEKIDPMEYAHIHSFMNDPAKVWDVLLREMKRVIVRAKPNEGHLGLAALEKQGKLNTIITQNVDGLHQLAGNRDVIEFHGNFAWQRCLQCGRRVRTADIDLSTLPPRCSCGGIFRPECIFFGEAIPTHILERSERVSSQCDLMLVIGTSAMVQPAATMPLIAKQTGAVIIEINPEKTHLSRTVSDIVIHGNAGKTVRQMVAEYEKLTP